MKIVLDKKEKLIYSILFSSKTEYEIDLQKYCLLDQRSEFREQIRNIIKKTGNIITEDRIMHRDEEVIWKLIFNR